MPGLADLLGGQVQMGQPNMAPAGLNFQQAGQFAQLVQPMQQPPVPQQTPPTTPQELEQRKSGWEQFMHSVVNDPDVRTAAMMAAGQLMRGPDMGENGAGMLGRAIQMGTLAHSFMKANRTRQDMEAQKLEQQRLANQADIARTMAQTQGLQQQQQQSAATHPIDLETKKQNLAQEQFQTENQPQAFESKMSTEATDRKLKDAHAQYYKDYGTSRLRNAGTGGPKTPAGVALMERQRQALAASNPRLPDENDFDYNARIEGMLLDFNRKGGSTVGSQVQALKTLIENTNPNDPAYKVYEQQLAAFGAGQPNPGAGKKVNTKEAMDAANAAAKAAGQTTFKGPDGLDYKVK